MLLFTNKTHSLLHISSLWHFSIKAHSAQQEQLNLPVLSVVLVREGSIGNIPYVLNTEAMSILCRADKTTSISSLCLFKHQKELQKASSQRLNFQVRLWSKALKNGLKCWLALVLVLLQCHHGSGNSCVLCRRSTLRKMNKLLQ